MQGAARWGKASESRYQGEQGKGFCLNDRRVRVPLRQEKLDCGHVEPQGAIVPWQNLQLAVR